MCGLFRRCKMKKELKEFKKFKESFKFNYQKFVEKDGCVYFGGDIVIDKNGNHLSEGKTWINAGYKLHGPLPKAISNLFPYTFVFRGHKIASIESVFQALRFKNKKHQKLIFKLSGIGANAVKVATDYNWKETYNLYFQGKEFNRNSKEFDDFIDEMYICAIQNPLFRGTLKKVDKQIIHTIGQEEKTETLFTRFEFEFMLNCLVAFLKTKND